MVTPSNFRIGKVTSVPIQYIKKYESKIVRPWLAISILCVLPEQDLDRQSFIQFCRSYSREKNFQDQLTDFELRYRPDEAIQWYTQPSGFPSKMVNNICRTQNPVLISKIRFYLKHIHEQLTRLYLTDLVWIPKSIVIYRGQSFSLRDFRRLARSCGKTVFTTTLLSTTGMDQIAAMFSGSNSSRDESSKNEIAVVFKIVIQTSTTHSKPFAYIQEYSHVVAEKEILLSIGTIFTCVSMRQKEMNSYEILLVRGRDEEKIENELLRQVEESYDHGATMTVNEFLISMNIDTLLLGDFHYQPLCSLFEENPDNIINEAPTDFSMTTEQYPTKRPNQDHLIIWLDFYIGQSDVCNDLKEKLRNAIDTTIDEPLYRNEIDRLIQIININPGIPNQLITVKTVEECLTLIDRNYQKKIFLITSGLLGRYLVPRVVTDYPYVERIFVFCWKICSYMDWALDFTENLLMFDFHDDVFARVVYDIGMYYMQQGICFSDLDEHYHALYYFCIAKKLVMRANRVFHPYFPFSLKTIEEWIIKEEDQLPRGIVKHVLSDISCR